MKLNERYSITEKRALTSQQVMLLFLKALYDNSQRRLSYKPNLPKCFKLGLLSLRSSNVAKQLQKKKQKHHNKLCKLKVLLSSTDPESFAWKLAKTAELQAKTL